MRIRITEQQGKRLFEARMDGFRVDYMAAQRSYKKRFEYCQSMLGACCGNGSSRAVFDIDDETVLKLAKNPKGVAQNMEEIRIGTDNYLSIVPKVMNGTDEKNGLWIIVERVLPAKSSDFNEILGVPFSVISEFARWMSLSNKRGYYDRRVDNMIHELYAKYENNDEVMYLFNEIHELACSYDNEVGDLTRLANWGMCLRDGEPSLVVLDAGLSQDVYNNYYRRR